MNEASNCSQCGSPNPVTNQFCGTCGAALSKVPSPSSPQEVPLSGTTHSTLGCPICHQMDQSQKITSILAAGTRTTTGTTQTQGKEVLRGDQSYYQKEHGYVGSSTAYSETQINSTSNIHFSEQSTLAKMLSRPLEPGAPVLRKYNFGCGWYLLFILIGSAAFIGTILLNVDRPDAFFEGADLFVIAIIAVIFSIGLISVLIDQLNFEPRRKKAQAVYDSELTLYKQKHKAWEKAMQRWSSSYYCFRDDVLFIPGENFTLPPAQIIPFCYSEK